MFAKIREMKQDDPEEFAFLAAYATLATGTVAVAAGATVGIVKLINKIR